MTTFELGAQHVSRGSGALLHAQVADAIRIRIGSGEWPAGHRLPPEPVLAEEIGISRGTLRKGLAALLGEGLLTRAPGRGTFVASGERPHASQLLSTLAEDVLSQGAHLSTRVLEAAFVTAPRAIAAELRLETGATVFRLVRVRETGAGPFALLHNYVVPELAPGIDQVDFAHETLFGVLEERCGLRISSARRRFSAVAAHSGVTVELDLSDGEPVQHLEQLTLLDDGRPVEYSEVWIDSSRLQIVVHLDRHRSTT